LIPNLKGSRLQGLSPIVVPAVRRASLRASQKGVLIMYQSESDKSVSLSEPGLRAPLHLLAPHERRAPIAVLSPIKQYALIACFNADWLHKRDGAWHGPSYERPLSGVTVADLVRDGMLTVTTNQRMRSAQLTTRGNWFARTLLDDAAGDRGSVEDTP
jgi:hypothetical protein